MTAETVVAVLDAIEGAGLRVWVDGGWGIDALLGRQHRDHDDVDLVVELGAVSRVVEVLSPLGFSVAEDHLPTRMVLRAPGGGQVDLHPVTFDVGGTGWQAGAGPGGGDCPYPAGGFTTGTVGGRPAGCLSADLQVQHHRGYEPAATDRHDMELLARAFGLVLPPPYG